MRGFCLLFVFFVLFVNTACDTKIKANESEEVSSKDVNDSLISFFKAKYASQLPADSEVILGNFSQSEIENLVQGFFVISMPDGRTLTVPFFTGKDKRYLIIGSSDVIDIGKLEKSKIEGLKKGSINLLGSPIPILVSKDGNKLIVGEVVDSTIDPLKEVFSQIELDNVPLKGLQDAKVTVVEYSDFQCPYCKRASDIVSELTKEYKEKIKVVFKQFPLPNHNWAMSASIASLCAYEQGNDKFWEVHDLIFESQSEITLENANKKFKKFAKQSKLDGTKFDKCLSSEAIAKRVDQEIDEGKSVGVSSTPTFIIDGIVVPGADIKAIKDAIDSRL